MKITTERLLKALESTIKLIMEVRFSSNSSKVNRYVSELMQAVSEDVHYLVGDAPESKLRENPNPQKVVMSREVYDELLRLAELSSDVVGHTSYLKDIAPVQRHVRKFNLSLHNERIASVRLEQDRQKRLRDRAKELVKGFSGKPVYRVEHYTHSNETHYLPYVLLGRGLRKGLVRVKRNKAGWKKPMDVYPHSLVTELPEGAIYLPDSDAYYKVDV